ncbi:MAG: 2-phospho-L-lactate guanylyltransferase [Streptosporangiaceae bacterium]
MAPEVAVEAELSWSLVVPVKVLAQAKSRLTGLAGQLRAELALAMAADTVAAAAAATSVAAVLVVTNDSEVSQIAARLGAVVLPDQPAGGLNSALGHGAAYSVANWPDRGRAALAGDLPALRPQELDAALAAAGHRTAFVADADGTGTTLYTAAPGTDFQPKFGLASRDRHLAAGAMELNLGDLAPGLRRDVDTVDDLRQAAVIGLGPRTRAVLTRAGGIPS